MENHNSIPALRQDLALHPIQENGKQFIHFSDMYGFASQELVISTELYSLLQLLDGEKSLNDIDRILSVQYNVTIDMAPFKESIMGLEQIGYLETENYVNYISDYEKEIANSPDRKAICAGSSYPTDVKELSTFLDDFLSIDDTVIEGETVAIIAPHIDFRIGSESSKVYSAAYNQIKHQDIDTVIILGTSHNVHSDLLMFTEKNYTSPYGSVETDREMLSKINDNLDITIDESAHRFEHSIELQVVLLQHLFKGKEFKILPILVGGLHEYQHNGSNPDEDKTFQNKINMLKTIIDSYSEKKLFIASVDFAHIGRKFDDDFDAEPILDILETEDQKLINHIVTLDENKFYDSIVASDDKWKICGTSPIYVMMKLIDSKKAEKLSYGQWNEIEEKSAVSFASIRFLK